MLIDELDVPLSGITITFFRDDLGYLEQTTNELGQFQFITPINEEEIEIDLEIEDNERHVWLFRNFTNADSISIIDCRVQLQKKK